MQIIFILVSLLFNYFHNFIRIKFGVKFNVLTSVRVTESERERER